MTLVALGVAGCTSSGSTSPSSSVPGPTASQSSVSPSPSSTPVTPTAVTSPAPSSTAPTSKPVSSTPSTSRPSSRRPSSTPPPVTSSRPQPTTTATLTAPPAGGGTCKAGQLSLSSVRGGASQGREYAAVVFTNSSAAACTMRGYPSAQLLRAGTLFGNPAAHDTTGTVRTLTVRPHRSVQSVLSAVSTCNSALSDHVRVYVPGSRTPSDVAVQLRACSLTIGPVDLP